MSFDLIEWVISFKLSLKIKKSQCNQFFHYIAPKLYADLKSLICKMRQSPPHTYVYIQSLADCFHVKYYFISLFKTHTQYHLKFMFKRWKLYDQDVPPKESDFYSIDNFYFISFLYFVNWLYNVDNNLIKT